MTPSPAIGRREDLTFKANLAGTRHGWLRLTPAYGVGFVRRLLDEHARPGSRVLDPFCGTGTTALACAERGLRCTSTDINPFLLWLAEAKTRRYLPAEIGAARVAAADVRRAALDEGAAEPWVPPMHRVDRWWGPAALRALGRALAAVGRFAAGAPAPAADLLRVAFCRAMIERAAVSFGHQSMSFKGPGPAADVGAGAVAASWSAACDLVLASAASPVPGGASYAACDARDLRAALPEAGFDLAVTSPPYPNRMSYVRELRPYMYWLGHLAGGREAGELDWLAIGGTWGVATSNLARWRPPAGAEVPSPGFEARLGPVAARSPALANYLRRYFHDMAAHCRGLFAVTRPGGSAHYVVGNSKFYDEVLPVESVLADLLRAAGFEVRGVEPVRRRSSKKELFEFVVSAVRP